MSRSQSRIPENNKIKAILHYPHIWNFISSEFSADGVRSRVQQAPSLPPHPNKITSKRLYPDPWPQQTQNQLFL